MGWLVIFLFTILTGGVISLEITWEYLCPLLNIDESDCFNSLSAIRVLFLLPLLVAIAINLFQMTLSLLIQPVYSFIITATILLSSAYYISPWLIGNYAMVIRSTGVLAIRDQITAGILICIILSVGSIIIGTIIYNKHDILNSGENE